MQRENNKYNLNLTAEKYLYLCGSESKIRHCYSGKFGRIPESAEPRVTAAVTA